MSYVLGYQPRRRTLHGLGQTSTVAPTVPSVRSTSVHPYGGGWRGQAPAGTAAPSSGASTAAQVAGTPVPVGYSTNSVFINSDGSQWEYSSSQGVFINVGTPYNLAAPSAATPTAATSTTAAAGTAGAASTAAQVVGSPVPVGTVIGTAYTDIYGNVWQFSTATGTWIETAIGTATTAATAASSVVPPGTSTATPYTDANGNTWTYSNGAWVMTASGAASPYSSILTWLSESTLMAGIPNWGLVAGIGLVAVMMMNRGKK